MIKINLVLFILFSFSYLHAQKNEIEQPYRNLLFNTAGAQVNPDSILAWFVKADQCMEEDRYDSAEYWLSKVGDRLTIKKPTVFNYYYHTRQAEVFYYNDLLQLGLQQSQRALFIAQQLGDSLFLADAYNFFGLFYTNLDKLGEAEKFLLKGLSYFKGNKKRDPILPLSKPYHLHGNLGEAYTKKRQFSKALYHLHQSILEAENERQIRAQAIAQISMGEILFEMNSFDSATKAIQLGVQNATRNSDFDVILLGQGALAAVFASSRDFKKAKEAINQGNALIEKNTKLNPYFTLQYLERVVTALKAMEDFELISKMQESIMTLEKEVRRKNNKMIEDVLSAGLKNENRLLQMEIEENKKRQKENNIRMAGLLVIMGLMFVAGLYYRNSLQQKLKLASIREKISQNLHDDIGASISSLHIYGSIAGDALKTQPDKVEGLLEKITEQSSLLMENMNDMVWSMKADEDAMTLDTRLKNYGAELLTVKDIHCSYTIEEDCFKLFTGYEQRKDILLFFKEAMNNVAKYSLATKVEIVFKQQPNKTVLMSVEDNGKGFDPATVNHGNGLKNLRSRVASLKGNLQILSAPEKGVRITAILPVP